MSEPDTDTEQRSIDPYREMNRYDGRDADWPSAEVFEPPRRTLANGWKKFHADRDCGRATVAFVEQNGHKPVSEKYEYDLYCWRCGHRVPEEEVLFIGGQWYTEDGWLIHGRMTESLWLPPERVLDLGPDPDQPELREALKLTRIESEAGPTPPPVNPDSWSECEECGHAVPLLFDDTCRMCYDGPWTDRMQASLNGFERHVREWHNHTFAHRLEQHVDPLAPGDTAPKGLVLWRREDDPGHKMAIVQRRFEDYDDGHMEYVLTDPAGKETWRVRADELRRWYWSMCLYFEGDGQPVSDDRIREIYQRVCDHNWGPVHDQNALPGVESCSKCRRQRERKP